MNQITRIEHVVELGTGLPMHWFRGHATREAQGQLTPRAFRGEVRKIYGPHREMSLIEKFKRDAPSIAPGRLPAEDDTLGWLYLMQHYQALTRLLDWTENALAALFFSVGDGDDLERDGELWALYPQALNQESAVGFGFPLTDRNPVLDFLTREPYHESPEALAQEIAEEYRNRASEEWLLDPKPFDRPVAFLPRRDFARMLVQSSVFTIHPEPSPGNTIPGILTDERFLVCYIVPHHQKPQLYRDLRALGITDLSLFPDFEGLSRTIAPWTEVVGWEPRQPPVCGGPYRPSFREIS